MRVSQDACACLQCDRLTFVVTKYETYASLVPGNSFCGLSTNVSRRPSLKSSAMSGDCSVPMAELLETRENADEVDDSERRSVMSSTSISSARESGELLARGSSWGAGGRGGGVEAGGRCPVAADVAPELLSLPAWRGADAWTACALIAPYICSQRMSHESGNFAGSVAAQVVEVEVEVFAFYIQTEGGQWVATLALSEMYRPRTKVRATVRAKVRARVRNQTLKQTLQRPKP